MNNNLDDFSLQPGDEVGNFTNQFKEFLQKNSKIEEPVKKEKRVKNKKVVKKKRTTSKFFV